jgi:PPK2 family polyphosphate:nucleotide phosphotransferase
VTAPAHSKRLAELAGRCRVEPGAKVTLADLDPADKADFAKKEDGAELLEQGVALLADLQDRLAAQATHGLLVCFQAMDAAGKDGTIKHVMSGVNPQGVRVHSFKAPSPEELGHDFLWRCVRNLPARGEIGIFNRSHYEEVLVVRVHPEFLEGQRLPPEATGKDIWKRRYRQINEWERHLVENGFAVVKVCLNVSREEQRRRFLKRLDTPEKNWKFQPGDVRERAYWDRYQEAYSEMLSNTSTTWAPWYVIPADRKWFARIAAAAVIAHTLIELDPQYPTVPDDVRREFAAARADLKAETPPRGLRS